MPPVDGTGVLLLNPPYGERIAAAGVAGQDAAARARRIADAGRERAVMTEDAANGGEADFFARLASHWKKHYVGWKAWVLSPDMTLPRRMRLQASRRVPLWNGPIECRLFCFDIVSGSPAKDRPERERRPAEKDTQEVHNRPCGNAAP